MINKKFIKQIPNEILYLIMKFSYNKQSKELILDINNFYYSKNQLYLLYFNYWIKSDLNNCDNFKLLILNDLLDFLNNYSSYYFGYNENLYSILSRNILLDTKNKINKYLLILETKDVESVISIFWGLMTINERSIILSQTKLN